VVVGLKHSVEDMDPGSGAFLTPGSGSGMHNPDHISESLETIIWIKILKFFGTDPGSGMEKKSDPGWNQFRSATLLKIYLRSRTAYFFF
jgi:hypothetical protein